ncbi:MAG: TauD/TfdA family dioxygenase [Pseudomonadota bacterium]
MHRSTAASARDDDTAAQRIEHAALIEDAAGVRVRFDDGTSYRFHGFWLRDNADDPTRIDPGNGQKLVTIQALDLDQRLAACVVEARGQTLAVQFADSAHVTHFDAQWLRTHAYDVASDLTSGWLPSDIEPWATCRDELLLSTAWSDLMAGGDALCSWLGTVRRFGVGRVTDGPTYSGCLLDLVEQFGFVRETNYGKWFEVRSEAAPVNLAYTASGLQAHTDNPYRDPPPTMQLLYCLADAADGGESVIVDGFAAALELRRRDPAAFELLRQYRARFAYRGADGVQLEAQHAVIETATDGELLAVHFNNRSAATVTDVPYDDVRDWYRALQQFADLVDEPARQVEFKLRPGDGFLVDNTRVLHARAAFRQSGARWLQGCYPDRDGLLSTWRVLRHRLEEQTSS